MTHQNLMVTKSTIKKRSYEMIVWFLEMVKIFLSFVYEADIAQNFDMLDKTQIEYGCKVAANA